MQDWKALERELARSGRAEPLRRLAQSADGQRLLQGLDAAALAEAARSGDGGSMARLLQGVLRSEEGKRLLKEVESVMKP